jgi:hypothetical protein
MAYWETSPYDMTPQAFYNLLGAPYLAPAPAKVSLPSKTPACVAAEHRFKATVGLASIGVLAPIVLQRPLGGTVSVQLQQASSGTMVMNAGPWARMLGIAGMLLPAIGLAASKNALASATENLAANCPQDIPNG